MAQKLRPYVGIDQFAGVLDGFYIDVPKIRVRSSGDYLELVKSDFASFEADLICDLSTAQYANQLEDALSATGLEADQVILFVRLRSPLLKKTLLVARKRFSEVDGLSSVKLFPNSDVKLVLEAPVIVQFGLVLDIDLMGHFPRPYRKGTWLELREITIRSERSAFSGFNWIPLTPDMRKTKGLPEKSVLHVEHRIPLFQAEKLQDAVDVYVDDQYLEAMSMHQELKVRTFLQHNLTAQVVASLLLNGLQNEIESSADTPVFADMNQNCLGAILMNKLAEQKMSDDSTTPVQDLWDRLVNRPVECVELIEDFFGVNVPAKKLLQSEGWSE
jgi:hypothetical protein